MQILFIFFIVALLFYGLSTLKKLSSAKTKMVLDKFKDKKVYGVSSNANFFGQESIGIGQIRGNGVLVLVEGQLYFQMWVPEKELSIKFNDILKVETPRSFLGKTKGRKLLKVVFKNDKGNTDSAAWQIGNIDHWQQSIEKIISLNTKY